MTPNAQVDSLIRILFGMLCCLLLLGCVNGDTSSREGLEYGPGRIRVLAGAFERFEDVNKQALHEYLIPEGHSWRVELNRFARSLH